MANLIRDRQAWIAECRQRHAEALKYYDEMGIYYEFADYKAQETLRYQGNPLIEALPLPWDKLQLIDRFGYYPEIEPDIRSRPKRYRRSAIRDVFQLVHPLDKHLEFGQALADVMRDGYVARNPLSRLRAGELSEAEKQKDRQRLRRQKELKTNLSLFGPSGMGKTTLGTESVEMYPQLIFHGAYKEVEFSQTQLVWIRVECPHDASRTAFVKSYFLEMDRVIYKGHYFLNYGQTNNVNELMKNIVTVSKNLCLGFLVIDEIQRLSKAKGGGSKLLLEFLVQFSNEVNLPIGYIGTSRAVPVITPNVHFARRLSEDTSPDWRRMMYMDKDWTSLMKALADYQYLHNPFEITPEISFALYDNSQGITALAVSLYAAAQRYAIDYFKHPEQESLSPSLINSVAALRFSFLYPALEALRKHDTTGLALFEDIIEVHRDLYENNVLEIGGADEAVTCNSIPSRETPEASVPAIEPPGKPTGETARQGAEESLPKKSGKGQSKAQKRSNPRLIRSNNDLSNLVEKGKKQKLSPEETLVQTGFIADASELLPK